MSALTQPAPWHRKSSPPPSDAPQLPPLGAHRLISAWLDSLSDDTIKSYRSDLLVFARFLKLDNSEAAVRALLASSNGEANLIALEFKNWMVKRGYAPASTNRRLAALRGFTKAARRTGLIAWQLEYDRVPAQPYRDTRGPGVAAIKLMMKALQTRTDALGSRDRAILSLLFDLGLRCKEVCTLDLEHVDPARGTLEILGKMRQQRERLTLPPSTAATLGEWIDARGETPGALFVGLPRSVGGHGRPEAAGRMSRQAVYRRIRLLGEALGFRARPHSIRHSSITHALDCGNGLREVSRHARHANPATTMIYDDHRQDLAVVVASSIALGGTTRSKTKRAPERALVHVPSSKRVTLHELGLKRGSASPNAKLDEAKVMEIRRRHAAGEGTTALATEFGVSAGNLRAIVARETWTHVA